MADENDRLRDTDCEAQGTEDEEVIVTLVDNDGKECDFTIVQVIRVDDEDYAVLLPANGEDEPDDEVFLRIEPDPETGEDTLVEIEDEDEFDRVAEAWEEILDEEEEAEEGDIQ